MSSSEPAVKTTSLGRSFSGRWAVHDLSLAVPSGSVYGLLGLNGSGKTTTLRLLMGLLRPSEGSAEVLGLDPQTAPVELKSQVGYVGDQPGFYDWMQVGELIDFVAHHRRAWDEDYADELRRQFGLRLESRVGALAKGERVMTALLLALGFRPRLLLLDEPTAALDPSARRHFFEGILDAYQEEGGTILVSSHQIREIAGWVDHVGILEGGRLVVSQPVDELQGRMKRYRLTFADGAPSRIDCPGLLSRNDSGRVAELVVELAADDDRAVREALGAYAPSRLETGALNLEEAFLALTGESRP
ncbi:MAG: ABC transporter ATP-binding protein [Acidobacteriota bacterium]